MPVLIAFELDGATSGNVAATGYLQLGSDENTRVAFTQTADVSRFTHEVQMNVRVQHPGAPVLRQSARRRVRSSCRGYNVWPAVPAHATTWGSLTATDR